MASVAASPAFAAPVVYNYSDQGVTFLLTVDDLGGTVNATLKVTADNTGDFLKYVGLKLFNTDPPSFTNGSQLSVTKLPATDLTAAYSFFDGFRVGGGTGNVNGVGGGFVGSDAIGNGATMDTSTYEFEYSWATATDPSTGPSIKMWTALSNGQKSRQWSSGELSPGTPPGGAPEPASLVLLGIGALYVARRRKRA